MVSWGPTTVFGGAGGGGGGTSQTAPGGTTTMGSNSGTGFSFASGAPASTSTSTFGSTNASSNTGGGGSGGLFGSSTNTGIGGSSNSGGLFGSSTSSGTTTSSFGGFGTTSSSTGGGLFGGGTNTGNSGGLFGNNTTSSSLFGTGTGISSPFGQQQQQQQYQQGPVLAAQDVYHVFLANHARKEEARIADALTNLYEAYTGTKQQQQQQQQSSVQYGSETEMSTIAPFTTVLYNPATGQQRQLMAAIQQVHHQQSSATDSSTYNVSAQLSATAAAYYSTIVERPIQITKRAWDDSLIQNPNPYEYVPIGIVGADALQARVLYQQQQCNSLQQKLASLQETLSVLRQRYIDTSNYFNQQNFDNQKLFYQRKRLLELMKKVEILRCWNEPIQVAEIDASNKLQSLKQHSETIRRLLTTVHTSIAEKNSNTNGSSSSSNGGTSTLVVRPASTSLSVSTYTNDQSSLSPYTTSATPGQGRSMTSIVSPNERQLLDILKQHRQQLTQYTVDIKNDKKDLQLIENRLVEQVPVPRRQQFRSI